MAFNYYDDFRKVAKWTDDIKRDIRFFGVGTVGKQIQYPNGSKVDYANEDRSFSYELKENEIFAYGIIDGFNGTWTVDFVEQCLMSNICFDHLYNLQSMSDEQIYMVLEDEFTKTENVLQGNLQELLTTRSSKALLNAELKKGTIEFLENRKEIAEIDKKIDSGAFATISLLIDDRLYVANVGTVHCFVCTYNKRTFEKRVTTMESAHTLTNISEMLRLADLKADVQEALLKGRSSSGGFITYTRCLGDFKHKLYYHEQPQFKDCTKPPISCNCDHPKTSLKIDDTFLFMAMYSDGLVKAIERTDMASENVNAIIARMLLRKIVSEQTLNSAAQSVLDEIKRAYDDKLMSTYNERDDFTLIVRVFDDIQNVKNKLVAIENHMKPSQSTTTLNSTMNGNDGRRATFIEEDEGNFSSEEERTRRNSRDSTLESTYSSLISTSISHRQNSSDEMETNRSADKTKREDLPLESLVDENGRVVPYVELNKLDDIINSSREYRNLFEGYCDELAALKIERI